MHDHLHLLGPKVKEVAGFNHLESFVHERGRIDGNLGPHLPVGMAQGVGRCDGGKAFALPCAEGATRSGEKDFLHAILEVAHEALQDGGVLTVYGQEGNLFFSDGVHDVFARHYECFLVGQGDGLAGLNGADGGTQSRKADHGCQDHIHGVHLHHIADGLATRIYLDGQVGECFAHLFVLLFVGNDNGVGLKFAGLLNEQVGIVSSGQYVGDEMVGMLTHHVKSLRADRARGT